MLYHLPFTITVQDRMGHMMMVSCLLGDDTMWLLGRASPTGVEREGGGGVGKLGCWDW